MKNKKLLLLFLCAIPVVALWEGGSQTSGDTAATGIAFLLPKANADFSDLDVRDAQNNAIPTPSAKQELETLFRENLLNLTVFASPHAITEAIDWLDSFSHLFNKLILMRIAAVFGAIQDAILPSNRRFVHNVHNLCITFSVGILAGCMLFSAFALQRSSRIINLRC